MKKLWYLFVLFLILSCQKSETNKVKKELKTPKNLFELSLTEANRLAQLPIKCIDTEFPNRLGQTLGSKDDIANPKKLHPAFYGCFDWHSAVHGHWAMVNLLKQYPDIKDAQALKDKLKENLSKENILAEVAYFKIKHNSSYERTYGWAWLLKLVEELHTWDDSLAKELETNLQPLTNIIVANYLKFLPKLNYAIRVGEHPNTAFGLTFAWDYAVAVNNTELKLMIAKRSKYFYLNDANCPMSWEPSGFDFLSPCLEEMDIMRRVLPEGEFKEWLAQFLPQLTQANFKLPVGKVSDRTDGKLVHLDGLNFSRAWCLYGLANTYPEYNYLKDVANTHIEYSLTSVVDGNYEGGHWLGSFALYALNSAKR